MPSLDAIELDLTPCSSSAMRKDLNGETPTQRRTTLRDCSSQQLRSRRLHRGVGVRRGITVDYKQKTPLFSSLLAWFFLPLYGFEKWEALFQDGSAFCRWRGSPHGRVSSDWTLGSSTVLQTVYSHILVWVHEDMRLLLQKHRAVIDPQGFCRCGILNFEL